MYLGLVMVGSLDPSNRSKLMASIKSKNTSPELLVRRGLHRLGFRYRLHNKTLSGKPDLALPKHKSVIFVNGCFWHGHNCHIFRLPKTRTHFWRDKIENNRLRDQRNIEACKREGWKVLVIWECSLQGKTKRNFNEVIHTTANWLLYDSQNADIEGKR